MKVNSLIRKISLLLLLLGFSGEAMALAASKSDWAAYRKLSPASRSHISEEGLQAYIVKSMRWLSNRAAKHQDRLRPKRKR